MHFYSFCLSIFIFVYITNCTDVDAKTEKRGLRGKAREFYQENRDKAKLQLQKAKGWMRKQNK